MTVRDVAGIFPLIIGRNGAYLEANADGSLSMYAASGKAVLMVGDTVLPAAGTPGQCFFLTGGPNPGLYQCVATDTWTQLVSAGNIPDASTIRKGIAELSWPAAIAGTPINTATTDPRVNVEVNATFAGVPNDGVTDAYASLQALINANAGQDRTGKFAIQLDNCRYQLSHPLRVPDVSTLLAHPLGSILTPNFGAGYTLVVGALQGNIVLGAPVWYVNSVHSMVSSATADKPYVNCSQEPNMFVRGLSAFTFDVVYQRTSAAAEGGAIVASTAFLGSVGLTFVAYEIIENIRGGFTVTWRGVNHDTDDGILDLDAHHLALVFDDPTVTLYLDGVNILDFDSAGPISQQYCETVCLAHEARDFQETNWRYAGINGLIGPARWSSIARWSANFVPPTNKPVVDSDTLLIVDPDVRDADYLVGSVGVRLFLGTLFPLAAPRSSYLLTAGHTEILIGHCNLSGITINGGQYGNYIASGFYFFSTIKSNFTLLHAAQTFIGSICAGVTFDADYSNSDFETESYGFGVFTQSESSSFRNIGANGGAFTVMFAGSVGGPCDFLITPGSTTSASLYIIDSSDLVFQGLQIDDEAQDTSALISQIIFNDCSPKIVEGILAITRPLNLITCTQGASPILLGPTIVCAGATPEIIHFEKKPDQPAIVDAARLGLVDPSTVMTLNPEWISSRQDFEVKSAFVNPLTELRFQDHTCLRIQQQDVDDPDGGVVVDVEARAAIAAMLLENRRSRWYRLDNVASQDQNGVATAQSFLSQPGRDYFPSYANNGDLKGVDQHFWNSAVITVLPQWLQVTFTAEAKVYEVVVVSVQDDYLNPVEPTDTMTFTLFGCVDFEIQSFDGVSWNAIEIIVGNNLVLKRIFLDPAFVGDALRLKVNTVPDGNYARCVEFQCWGKFT
jgi:hypothetical protein